MKKKNNILNPITVKITGLAGSGKSTIAYEISKLLKRKGIDNSICDFEGSLQNQDWVSKQDKRMKSLKAKTFVFIKDLQSCSMKKEKK